ncbi:MAG: phosphate signaling complex PhoU family protein [Rubrobacteraceae bacterium]
MRKRHLDDELERLIQGTVALGWEVQSSLSVMVRSLEDHDARSAARQIGDDAKFKSWAVGLDEEFLRVQACQAPVARDLRLLHAARAVPDHLARAGTLCEHIFRAIAGTPEEEGSGDFQRVISRMARATHELFREGLTTFEQRDPCRAKSLRAADDEVDLLYSEALTMLTMPSSSTAKETISPEWWARVPLIVHYLERIADRGVEIGELAAFVVEGERVGSVANQRPSGRREG